MEHSLTPDEKILEILVHEEEQIRKSQWYLDECNRVANIPNGWMNITEECQKTIVTKHIKNDIMVDFYILWLRRAHHIFPNNEIFKNRLQVKYNRARIGELKTGDNVPDFFCEKLTDGVNIFVGSSQT
jgi:hypothetical protein